MRILILILATFVVHILAADKNATITKATTKLKPVTKTGKPGEFREKRTLYSFGNFGYNNNNAQYTLARNRHQAQRRISAYGHQDYYPQDAYSGQFGGPPNTYVPDTNNNYLDQHPAPYYHHSPPPQYVEPPEPIIEIIIKESNETLPGPAPQPHFIKKKKKEQVQVFYVNYKKGQGDKLQLENPIPALTPIGYQNSHETEEEEEIVHTVTPLPKLKTTTLRTIIHPESEKFHSNSGVHVSFNAEDKYQSGHQLQENDEGSEIKSVVALPNPQFPPNHRPDYHNVQYPPTHHVHQTFAGHSSSSAQSHQNYQPQHQPQPQHHPQSHPQPQPQPILQNHQFNHRFNSNYRTDYSRSQQNFNNNFRSPNYQPSQATHLRPLPPNQYQEQQAPPNHQPANFNGFSSHGSFRQNNFHNQQPVTHLTPRSPPFIPQNTTPRYSVAPPNSGPHGSPYNRPPPPNGPPPHNGPPPPQPPRKQQIYFPNDGVVKTHIKSHVNYQPLKYNQPQSGPHKPIPIPLHSIPADDQQQSYNRPVHFGPPSPPPPPQYTQHQPHPENNPGQPHFRPRPTPQYPSDQPEHNGAPQFGHSSPEPQAPSPPPQQLHFQQNKFFSPAPPNQVHNTNPEPNKFFQQGLPNHEPNKFFQPGPPNHHAHNGNPEPNKQFQSGPPNNGFNQGHNQHQSEQNKFFQPGPPNGGFGQSAHISYQESNKFFQSGPPQGHDHNGFNQPQQQHNEHLNPENPLDNLNVPFLGNVKSEFIKSVPRFEQHYTETIGPSSPAPQYNGNTGHEQSQKPTYNEFTSQANQNNVIQTVPSPNLGPTTPQPLQYHPSSTPSFGIGSTSSHHVNNFEAQHHQQHNYASSTLNSVFSGGDSSTPSSLPLYSQNHHQDHLQIVTPASASSGGNSFYSQHQSFNGFNQNRVQPQIIPNSQPLPHKLPAPGHSVSTIHTEALKELERLKSAYFGNNQQQYNAQPLTQQLNHQDFVSISGRNQLSAQQHSSSTPSFAPNHRYNPTAAPSTTTTTTTTTTEATTTTTTEKAPPKAAPNVVLPDEVPDDLRQQLFSSGILDNADISVLDYDKLGDTALENLPPEHLAHFYGAGGGSQISGSSKVLSVVKPNGEKVSVNEKQKFKEHETLPKRENLDLKVVRFDSKNQKSVTDKYIRPDAKVLAPVELNSPSFNRYLPLKVNGAQFPLPDVQELKGKRVSSVVVLAPVDPQQEVDESASFESRQERGLSEEKRITFIAGDSLKQLLKKPTRENFKRWLEKESRTDIDFQSVVLLVTKNNFDQQEIFMYDISTKEINKLDGALSTAFVNVAEENASSQDIDNASISDSGIVERMTPVRKQDTIVDMAQDTKESTTVRFSSKIQSRRDDETHPVYISSGYSVIKK